MTQTRPADWKNYDDFAAGIATNRLRASAALVGRVLRVNLPALTLTLRPTGAHTLEWHEQGAHSGSGSDWYEAIEGQPAETLVRESERATMLVVGSRGHG